MDDLRKSLAHKQRGRALRSPTLGIRTLPQPLAKIPYLTGARRIYLKRPAKRCFL